MYHTVFPLCWYLKSPFRVSVVSEVEVKGHAVTHGTHITEKKKKTQQKVKISLQCTENMNTPISH